jgi:AraC-like DNA-binding protein
MPASLVRRFSEPDEYVAHLQATKAEVSITRPGRFEAKLTRISLHRLWMQQYEEALPRVARFENTPGRAIVAFQTRTGPGLVWDGAEAPPGTLLRLSEGQSGFLLSTGPSHFGTMSLPVADLEAVGATMGDSDFSPPREPQYVIPSAAAMERLRSLHEAAARLAEHAPRVIDCPESARGLEQSLIAALADCLIPVDRPLTTVLGNRDHARIMKRFYAMLAANPDRVVHPTEVCQTIGISRRLLATCCTRAIGMGPYHYLRLRQLHLTRRALLLGDPATVSVTEIATAHAFWELGRFAVAYRALFGETPSATLRRAAGDGTDSVAMAHFPLPARFA